MQEDNNMKTSLRNAVVLLVTGSLLLSACRPGQSASPADTPAAVGAPASLPTETQTATQALPPTVTLTPTITLTPTATLPARSITGDWVVTADQTVENEAITLDGNLLVKSGSNLTLNNMELRLNVQEDGKNRIQVEPGAALSISGCDIASTSPDKDFLFIVDRAKFILKDSLLSNIGTGGFAQAQYQGLALLNVEAADITGNTFNHPRSTGISMNRSNHATIRNNKFLNVAAFSSNATGGEFAVDLNSSSNNLISDNTFVDEREAVFVHEEAFNNTIEHNVFLGALYAVSIRHGAGNTLVQNNQIGGPGHAQFAGLYLDTTPYPNVFINNTVSQCYVGAFLSYTANATIANNTFKDFKLASDDPSQYIWRLGGIYMFHSHNNQVSNNQVDGAADGGITLLFSPQNAVQGNRVSTSKYGLGLWYDSNQNQIENNLLDANPTNLILEKTAGNTLTLNNFQGGGNAWSKNHWSQYTGKDRGDGTGDVPYTIAPAGQDPAPLASPSAQQTFALPVVDWAKTYTVTRGPGYKTITGNELWKDQTVPFVWGHLEIESGGSLTLDHAKLVGAAGWGDEPQILVNSGGTLEIDSSEISGGDFSSPIAIFVNQGGIINIRNSTLHNVGWASGMEMGLLLGGDSGTIENNIFDGCYSAIISGGGHYQILNNTIRRCQFGIVVPPQGNHSVVQGNTITDIVDAFKP